MPTVIITGSGAGLGKAIYQALRDTTGLTPFGIDKKTIVEKEPPFETIDYFGLDISKKDDWKGVLGSSTPDFEFNDIVGLINCAGINKICPFEDITCSEFDEVIGVNVKGMMLASQHCLKALKKNKGFIVNVVSNASHMPMTDSFVYNASKGAAAIATRQMARELTKRHGITVFGISPNKLSNTEMSDYIDNTFPPMRGMNYEEGRKYQLNGLLTGKETSPVVIANLLAYLLGAKSRHKYLSGCILELGL